MKKPLSFLLFSLLELAYSQDLKKDLLLCHAEPGVPQFRQKIMAYHFVNGVFTGKDEVMQVDGRKDGHDYVRLDQGKNQFYQQRYVITGIGNIIDLKTKKVMFDGRANLVRISNDSAIYYTNDAFKGKFYSVFDFKTGRYAEVKDLLFHPKRGQDIEFDKKQKPFHLYYYPKNKSGVILTREAGYGQQNLPGLKYIPDPPVFWITDSVFIFPAFSADGKKLEVVKADITNAAIKVIGTSSVTALVEEAFFEQNGKETVVFYVGGSQLVIDFVRNTVSTRVVSLPEKGFTYATSYDMQGRSVFYNGKEIGRLSFDLKSFKVTDSMAALVKMMVVGNETYQQGLQVWHVANQSWQKIETEEIAAVIGWIDAGTE